MNLINAVDARWTLGTKLFLAQTHVHLDLSSGGQFVMTPEILSSFSKSHWQQIITSDQWLNRLFCQSWSLFLEAVSNSISSSLYLCYLLTCTIECGHEDLACEITRSISYRARMVHYWTTNPAHQSTSTYRCWFDRWNASGMEFYPTKWQMGNMYDTMHACLLFCIQNREDYCGY